MAINKEALVRETHSKLKVSLAPIPTGVPPRTTRISGIRAVLFDIYGTLLISGSGDVGTAEESSRTPFFAKALENAGVDASAAAQSAERYYFEAITNSHKRSRDAGIEYPEVDIEQIWLDVLTRLERERNLSLPEHDDISAMVAIAYEALANPVSGMPKARGTLEELPASCEALGIVSNAQFFTPILLEYELGSRLESLGFHGGACSYSYIAGSAKPSADIFMPALDYLSKSCGIVPGNILYVGNDMLNDIYTATMVGCKTCLFAGDKRSLRLRSDDPRCADLEPDAVITELTQLNSILT